MLVPSVLVAGMNCTNSITCVQCFPIKQVQDIEQSWLNITTCPQITDTQTYPTNLEVCSGCRIRTKNMWTESRFRFICVNIPIYSSTYTRWKKSYFYKGSKAFLPIVLLCVRVSKTRKRLARACNAAQLSRFPNHPRDVGDWTATNARVACGGRQIWHPRKSTNSYSKILATPSRLLSTQLSPFCPVVSIWSTAI